MSLWIESHTNLVRHRKLVELAKTLRLKPAHAMGHLHALWHAALEQQEDGDLSSWTDDFIAESSCYTGNAPQYVRMLQEKGWLDGKLLHDWPDYAGKYLVRKYSTSNLSRLTEIWVKHGREYGKKSSEQTDTRKRPESEPTLPYPTLPDQTLVHKLGSAKRGAEKEAMQRLKILIGEPDYEEFGATWRKRYQSNSGKFDRIMANVEQDIKEGKEIHSISGHANWQWDNYAD